MSAKPSHCFRIVVSKVHYTVQPMPISKSWCFPGVQSALKLVKPCAGDKMLISFTQVHEHMTSLVSLSRSMWSNNVSKRFTSNHIVPVPHYDGVRLTSSIPFKNFFDYVRISRISFTSPSSYSDGGMHTCISKIFTSSPLIGNYMEVVTACNMAISQHWHARI
jgi:hypothetical protein